MPSSLFLGTILLLATLTAADYTCPTCVCTSFVGTTALARGDSAPLCIQFLSSTTALNKTAVALKVDEYSAVIISGAHQGYASSNANGEVRLFASTSAGMNSTAIPFAQWDGTALSFVTNIYSLVIRLDKGIIAELLWDNTCAICSSTDCLTETLYNDTVPTNLCNVASSCNSTNTDASCDPKIYVTWVGTDSSDNTLTSAGLRLSRFVQYSIQDLYIQAQTVAQGTISDIQSAASGVSVS